MTENGGLTWILWVVLVLVFQVLDFSLSSDSIRKEDWLGFPLVGFCLGLETISLCSLSLVIFMFYVLIIV